MNLVKLLDRIKIDPDITTNPVEFLLFKELHLEKEYTPLYLGGYRTVFSKETLNKYFQDEITYHDILQSVDLPEIELPFQDIFIPLIKERLEEIETLPEPVWDEEKMIIFRSLLDTPNAFISLPYITKSIHKHELLTLLALTEWNPGFMTAFGGGWGYAAIIFESISIFDIDELEVYLPYDEMKNLIDQLPHYHYEKIYEHLEFTKKSLEKRDKEILNYLSSFKV
ncbi:hypothetical protein [Priestia endophytica]|uniref:DUF4375 domain-containing protein n=1 Tax=Priestia endophytica DSM 13796 TaxID=1121089 RepID=A0A1I6C0P4_9BACI|nr:hypothetical protein [Priestia endophytica]KYG33419.1 hypothetical protein AZF06_21480 [Priestia endophytica]SFQ86724.1 hypothetical protein SAMN02745910_04708 [Priestia endophytica DSM 13796]